LLGWRGRIPVFSWEHAVVDICEEVVTGCAEARVDLHEEVLGDLEFVRHHITSIKLNETCQLLVYSRTIRSLTI
jgi:hypothetical protein